MEEEAKGEVDQNECINEEPKEAELQQGQVGDSEELPETELEKKKKEKKIKLKEQKKLSGELENSKESKKEGKEKKETETKEKKEKKEKKEGDKEKEKKEEAETKEKKEKEEKEKTKEKKKKQRKYTGDKEKEKLEEDALHPHHLPPFTDDDVSTKRTTLQDFSASVKKFAKQSKKEKKKDKKKGQDSPKKHDFPTLRKGSRISSSTPTLPAAPSRRGIYVERALRQISMQKEEEKPNKSDLHTLQEKKVVTKLLQHLAKQEKHWKEKIGGKDILAPLREQSPTDTHAHPMSAKRTKSTKLEEKSPSIVKKKKLRRMSSFSRLERRSKTFSEFSLPLSELAQNEEIDRARTCTSPIPVPKTTRSLDRGKSDTISDSTNNSKKSDKRTKKEFKEMKKELPKRRKTKDWMEEFRETEMAEKKATRERSKKKKWKGSQLRRPSTPELKKKILKESITTSADSIDSSEPVSMEREHKEKSKKGNKESKKKIHKKESSGLVGSADLEVDTLEFSEESFAPESEDTTQGNETERVIKTLDRQQILAHVLQTLETQKQELARFESENSSLKAKLREKELEGASSVDLQKENDELKIKLLKVTNKMKKSNKNLNNKNEQLTQELNNLRESTETNKLEEKIPGEENGSVDEKNESCEQNDGKIKTQNIVDEELSSSDINGSSDVGRKKTDLGRQNAKLKTKLSRVKRELKSVNLALEQQARRFTEISQEDLADKKSRGEGEEYDWDEKATEGDEENGSRNDSKIISSLEAQIKLLREKTNSHTKLQYEIDKLKKEVELTQAEKMELKKELGLASKKLEEQTVELFDTQQEHAVEVEELLTTIKELNKLERQKKRESLLSKEPIQKNKRAFALLNEKEKKVEELNQTNEELTQQAYDTQKELTKAQNTIKRLQKQIDRNSEDMEDLKVENESRVKLLNDRIETLRSANELLQERERNLRAKEATQKKRGSKGREQIGTLHSRQMQLLVAQVTEKDTLVQQRNQKITRMKSTLKSDKKTIASLTQQLKEQEEKTESLSKEMEEKDNKIRELENMLESRPRSLAFDKGMIERGSPEQRRMSSPSMGRLPFETSDSVQNLHDERLLTKRSLVLREIWTTERTYVANLQTMVDGFIVPLTGKRAGLLSKEVINVIFFGVETLLPLHRNFLNTLKIALRKLEVQVPEEFDMDQQEDKFSVQDKGLAEIFIELGEELMFYTDYVNNYMQAIFTLRKVIREIPEFAEYYNSEEVVSGTKGLDLAALLITPIQRIPRYRMLLTELVKYTSENDNSYEDLNVALTRISTIAKDVDLKAQRHENTQKAFKRMSTPFVELSKATRVLMKEGVLQNERKADVYLFLFNDVLVVSDRVGERKLRRMKKKNKEGPIKDLICKQVLDIIEVEVQVSPDARRKDSFGFKISTPTQRAFLFAKSEKERNEWMDSVVEAKRQLLSFKDKNLLEEELKFTKNELARIEAEALEKSQLLETKEQQLLEVQRSVKSGTKQLKAQEKEIWSKSEELSVAKKEVEKMTGEVEKMQKEIGNIEAKLEQKEIKLEEQTEVIASFEVKVEHYDKDLADKTELMKKLSAELEKLKTEREDDLQKRSIELQQSLEKSQKFLDSDFDSVDTDLDKTELLRNLEVLRRDAGNLWQAEKELRLKSEKELSDRIQQLESDIKQIEIEKKAEQDEFEKRAEESVRKAKEKIEKQKQDLKEMKIKMLETMNAKEEKEKCINNLELDLKKNTKDLHDALASLKKNKDKLRQASALAERRKKELSETKQQLEQTSNEFVSYQNKKEDEIRGLNLNVQDLTDKHVLLEKKLNKKRSKLELLYEQNEEMEKQLKQRMENEKSGFDLALTEMEKRWKESKAEVESLQKLLEEAHIKNNMNTEVINDFSEKNIMVQNQLEEMRMKIQNQELLLAQKEKEKRTLSDILTENIEALEQRINSTLKDKEALEADLEDMVKREIKLNENFNEQLKVFDEQLQSAKQSNEEKRKALLTKIDKKEAEGDKLRGQLAEKEVEIEALKRSRLKAEQDWGQKEKSYQVTQKKLQQMLREIGKDVEVAKKKKFKVEKNLKEEAKTKEKILTDKRQYESEIRDLKNENDKLKKKLLVDSGAVVELEKLLEKTNYENNQLKKQNEKLVRATARYQAKLAKRLSLNNELVIKTKRRQSDENRGSMIINLRGLKEKFYNISMEKPNQEASNEDKEKERELVSEPEKETLLPEEQQQGKEGNKKGKEVEDDPEQAPKKENLERLDSDIKKKLWRFSSSYDSKSRSDSDASGTQLNRLDDKTDKVLKNDFQQLRKQAKKEIQDLRDEMEDYKRQNHKLEKKFQELHNSSKLQKQDLSKQIHQLEKEKKELIEWKIMSNKKGFELMKKFRQAKLQRDQWEEENRLIRAKLQTLTQKQRANERLLKKQKEELRKFRKDYGLVTHQSSPLSDDSSDKRHSVFVSPIFSRRFWNPHLHGSGYSDHSNNSSDNEEVSDGNAESESSEVKDTKSETSDHQDTNKNRKSLFHKISSVEKKGRRRSVLHRKRAKSLDSTLDDSTADLISVPKDGTIIRISHATVKNQDLKSFQQLMEREGPKTLLHRDLAGNTVLHVAAIHGALTILQYILMNPTYHHALTYALHLPNEKGETPLLSACKYAQLDVISLLLLHGGSEVREHSKDFNNALHYLLPCFCPHFYPIINHISTPLKKSGLHQHNTDTEDNSSHEKCVQKNRKRFQKFCNIINELISNGVPVNAKNNKGWTPLGRYFSMNCAAGLSWLSEAPFFKLFDLTCVDLNGETLLQMAVREERDEEAQIILDSLGANITINKLGKDKKALEFGKFAKQNSTNSALKGFEKYFPGNKESMSTEEFFQSENPVHSQLGRSSEGNIKLKQFFSNITGSQSRVLGKGKEKMEEGGVHEEKVAQTTEGEDHENHNQQHFSDSDALDEREVLEPSEKENQPTSTKDENEAPPEALQQQYSGMDIQKSDSKQKGGERIETVECDEKEDKRKHKKPKKSVESEGLSEDLKTQSQPIVGMTDNDSGVIKSFQEEQTEKEQETKELGIKDEMNKVYINEDQELKEETQKVDLKIEKEDQQKPDKKTEKKLEKQELKDQKNEEKESKKVVEEKEKERATFKEDEQQQEKSSDQQHKKTGKKETKLRKDTKTWSPVRRKRKPSKRRSRLKKKAASLDSPNTSNTRHNKVRRKHSHAKHSASNKA